MKREGYTWHSHQFSLRPRLLEHGESAGMITRQAPQDVAHALVGRLYGGTHTYSVVVLCKTQVQLLTYSPAPQYRGTPAVPFGYPGGTSLRTSSSNCWQDGMVFLFALSMHHPAVFGTRNGSKSNCFDQRHLLFGIPGIGTASYSWSSPRTGQVYLCYTCAVKHLRISVYKMQPTIVFAVVQPPTQVVHPWQAA